VKSKLFVKTPVADSKKPRFFAPANKGESKTGIIRKVVHDLCDVDDPFPGVTSNFESIQAV